MRKHRNPILLLGITILCFGFISAACSFSGRTLDAPSLAATQVNSLNLNPTVTLATVPTQAAAEPSPQNDEGQAQIPETGTSMAGELAGPVTDPPDNLEELYTRANPAVVSIIVRVNQDGQVGAGSGSGFILTDKGYIATNHHVIEGAESIIVRFYNNADIRAELVGDDPNSDLAIIKVPQLAEGAYPIPLGDSGKVAVGDSVVAIGNPFALGTSMSAGIVSAVSRLIPSGFTPYSIPEAIQTDAAINPGNSGGPLINMRGEVVGINAQIRVSEETGGNTGIGFAIPINILKLIYPSLIEEGVYHWPYLGVSSPSENALLLNADDLQEQQGALIAEVEPDGPADQAGIRAGDIVTQADDTQIDHFDDLLTYIMYKKPGDVLQLTILRDGNEQSLSITLGERPRGDTTLDQ